MLQVSVTMPCHNKTPEEHCEEGGESQGDGLWCLWMIDVS